MSSLAFEIGFGHYHCNLPSDTACFFVDFLLLKSTFNVQSS